MQVMLVSEHLQLHEVGQVPILLRRPQPLGLGTGDQPSFVTLNANVNASNVVSTDIYGTIQGSNTISSSTVNAITLNANVNASNIVTNDGRGINQLNASNVSIGTQLHEVGRVMIVMLRVKYS